MDHEDSRKWTQKTPAREASRHDRTDDTDSTVILMCYCVCGRRERR
jgi:hypothetical protein